MKRIDVTNGDLIAVLNNALSDMSSHLYRISCDDNPRDEAGQPKIAPELRKPTLDTAKRILELTTLLVEE